MVSTRKLGTGRRQRGLLTLGGILVFILARIVYLEPHVLEEYQIMGQDGHLASNKAGIIGDVLEPQRRHENITVTRVATDVERTQLMALSQFAHETCSSMGLDIFAMGGTLLGSLRHHDFIPWDDDMDFYVVLDNWSQVLEIHEVFEKRGRARPHPEFGPIGKTAPNLTPHCWKQKICNVTEELPHGRPFLGMFRTHFMSSRKVGWRYDFNCTKEDDRWCSRWPSVDIFMFLKEKEVLRNIIGWPGPRTHSVQDVYPLRTILFHGVLLKAPTNPGNFLTRYGYPGKDWEFGSCHGGGNHRGGGMVHFKTNCTQLWDQVPFVRHREQTENETVEIAYLNNTIVSVLKLDGKGKRTCHATMLSGQRNGCGAEFGL
mmetsp:Transcript_41527/g.68099  ORF Transcript_41527/g.68099 Transcript_41527/m.68099 type:complete len:373 (-) Transcript_41527:163-1281(-)